MTRLRTIALAASLPASILAVAGNAAATAPPGTEPPSTAPTGAAETFPAPTGEIPADWVWLVDDSQTIELAVPAEWADVRTVGTTPDVPLVAASTDYVALYEQGAFDVAGVRYAALPFDADTAGQTVNDYAAQHCHEEGVRSYDDGVFVGRVRTFVGCGGAGSTIHMLAANSGLKSPATRAE